MELSRIIKWVVKVICVVLLCLICSLSQGQEIKIRDASTQEPVPYANISIGNENLLSDIHGKFILDETYIGDTVRISVIGYNRGEFIVGQLPEDAVLYLYPSLELLSTITISGSRWAEKTNNTPLKIERIGKDEVKLSNPQTAADLLGNMNHVYVQKSQLGGGSPIIRGFSTSRILIAVDGVRMNNAIIRAGNVQNVLSVDPLSIESVEVSYGPGAVLYGSDAIGGVLNFYTLSPDFSKNKKTSYQLNSTLRYSSANDEKTFHTDLSIGLDKIAFLSSLSISDFGNLRMGSHGPDDYLDEFIVYREDMEDKFSQNIDQEIQIPTAYNQFSTLQKIKYRPTKDAFLTYGLYYSELSDVPRYDRMILTRDGLPRYGKWNYGPQKWFFQNIKFETSKTNSVYDQLAMVVGHQIYQESRFTRNFNEAIENVRKEKLNIVTMNLDMKKSLNSWSLYYGLEGVYNDVKSNAVGVNVFNSEENTIASRYPSSDWFSYGLYFSTKKKLSDRFNLNAGARISTFSIYSDFSNSELPLPFDETKLNFSTISGNLGLVHKLTAKQTLNYVLSTGMRAPNVDDIGKIFDSTPGIVVVPNPDLNAERALNAEINYQYLMGEKLSFETSVYYTHLDNAMVRRDFTINGQDSIFYDGALSKVQSVQNAANAYVGGIQLLAEYNMSKNWTIRGSYNFQKGEEETDDGTNSNSRHVVPDFGRFSLKYDNPVWYFKTEFNFQNEMSFDNLPLSERDKSVIYALDENGNPFSPSWWIVNIKSGYSFGDDFRINMGIDNLFDKRYRPFSSGISGSGINFYTAINYSI